MDPVDVVSNIEVKEYTEAHHKAWDEFIRNTSRNGGIFQERDFLSYHEEGKFKDASLLFFEKGTLMAVFPAAFISENQNEKVVSHPGSSCGGLIFHSSATLQQVLEILESLIEFYNARKIDSIEMRLAEPIFNAIPDEELRYLLWHRGFTLKSQEISTCVKLTETKIWEKLCRKRNLSYIKQQEKEGVKVVETEDIDKVYPVIEMNLKVRYNRIPTHTKEELMRLKQIYPGRIHYWVAEKDDQVLGILVVFDVNATGVHSFYIAKNEQYDNVKAMPLLFHKVFEHYYQQGYAWFNFGISSRGQQIKWGILEFKENVGGRATARQIWHLDNISAYKKYEASPPATNAN
jgi:hypothetical protein